MKKAICILLFLPQLVFGQHDTANALKQTYVGVGGGISMAPRRMFNSASNTLWMDYVKTGYCVNAFVQSRLGHSHFGITGAVTYSANSFDIDKYLVYNLPDPTATVTAVSYGSFSQFAALVGAYYTFSVKKLSFELRAGGGLNYLSLPNVEIKIHDPPSQPDFTLTNIYKTSIALAGSAGISIDYPIGKSLLAKLNLDVLFADADYSFILYKDYIINIDYTYNYPSNKAQVFMFGTTLSLCYGFGK